MSFPSNAFFILTLLLVSAIAPCMTKEEIIERNKTLIIGMVSNNPAKQFKRLQPISEDIKNKLNRAGITRIEIFFARNYQELIDLIKSEKVEWITQSVISALLYEQKTGARIFLKRWKKNTPWYHSVFITRKDSGINSLNQLPGKTLALEDNGATTGLFLPVIDLMNNGIPSIYLPKHDSLLKNQVGYLFSSDEINIASWVFQGLVHVVADSNSDRESENRTPLNIKKDLKIIGKTADYPLILELLAAHVSKALEKQLTQILLNAEFDPEGIKALKNYQNTTRFERLDKHALNAIVNARALFPQFDKHLVSSQPATDFKDTDSSPL